MCGAGIAGGASEARADWPTVRLVATGTPATGMPYGAAIRNFGPTGDVFILVDKHTLGLGNKLTLSWYTCNGATCQNAPTNHLSPALAVGGFIPEPNAIHPTLAVRSANGERKLTIVGRQKIVADCDGDTYTVTSNPVDNDDLKALDLQSWRWSTGSPNTLTSILPVELNQNNTCRDTGFSVARFLNATAHVCYTWDLTPNPPLGQPENQNVACNDDDGAAGNPEWIHHVDLTTTEDVEDHPSFDFYLPTAERAVAAHERRSTQDRVRVHFPDASAPPTEPIVSFGPTIGDEAQHPWVTTGNGKLHLVWQQTDAATLGGTPVDSVEYRVCDFDATEDCTLQLAPPFNAWGPGSDGTVVDDTTGWNDSAKMAQIETDGANQFVVWQYDDDPLDGEANQRIRVMFATRCEGDPWVVEYVEGKVGPTFAAVDQSLFYGRPSLAVDRTNHLLHLVLVEADVYHNGDNFDDATTSTVYWYTRSYTPCP